MQLSNILSWLLRIIVAVIFIQTLYFKFTGHPDSVYIFSKLGVEPYGRIGLGISELIVAILLLIPSTKVTGIILSFGIICGAIMSHFLVIGTEIAGDSGRLFALAIVVLLACIFLYFIHRKEVKQYIKIRL
jgi:putative oxidoreductase